MYECAVCRKWFRSEKGFSKHRTGDYEEHTRRCLSLGEMEDIGMMCGRNGVWVTEGNSKIALLRTRYNPVKPV